MTPSRAFTPLRDFAPAEAGDAGDDAQETNLIDEAEANERLERAVQEAREEAYAQGEAAGKANVEGTIQASVNASLGAVKAQLEDLIEKEDDLLNKVEIRAVRLILAIAQKLTTDLSDAEAEKFAAAVARRAMNTAQGAPSVEIKVSQELLEPIRDSLAGALNAAIETGRAAITPDPSLNRASVYVSWSNGSVAFDPSEMESAVSAIVSDALAKLNMNEPQFTSQEKTDGTASD